MYRACQSKDQTLKKIRTLHSPEKGCELLLMFLGGGIRGRVHVGSGGVVSCTKRGEKGRGWGVWGVECGQATEPANQCASVCQNYPLANYPLVSPWKFALERNSHQNGQSWPDMRVRKSLRSERSCDRIFLWQSLLYQSFKIITCMKLLFSNYLVDYSFQGSYELISITVAVSLFFTECSYRKWSL